ncbi:MAG: helix-turn-helix transcriptional regulator [Oscillospiraceae bacterium]|nr:helix-turn-helix transcriptional regulator [Oscillospiraceae bacterium]
MKLSEKILSLRKSRGMSQEELAEKLDVSRQAVSRWENGSALPDAENILRLSRLFGVTADYLLNDGYQSDDDLPKVQQTKSDGVRQVMFYLVLMEIMVLLMQFMTVIILQSVFFGVLSFIPFVALIGGFEYASRKKGGARNEQTDTFRIKFYKISAWLGSYFPVRLGIMALVHFWPRPFNSLVLECVILAVYLAAAALITLEIDRRSLKK